MAATEHVILVDENDQPLGSAEKIHTHREGLCHRAFSVMVYRKWAQLEFLIQQRAEGKYHCPGLWTNTCCSHPRPGEETVRGAKRRLKEELGIEIDLTHIGQFHYISHFNNGLTENEVDHVFIGQLLDQKIVANPAEIHAYRWISLPDLHAEITAWPERFTPWFHQVLQLTESAVRG